MISRLRAASRWGPVAVLGGVGALSLVVLEWDYRRGLDTLQATTVAMDNLTRARIAVAEAARAWEAAEGRNPTYDPTEPIARLDDAAGALEDLLEGRSTLVAFRDPAPVGDPELRALIRAYLARVTEIRSAATAQGEPRDRVEQRMRLHGLAGSADDLEAWVYGEVRAQLEGKRRWHRIALVAWGGFLALVLAVFAALRSERVRAQLRWRQAERRRASAERRYASLERLASVGVIRVDETGGVKEASLGWERLLGRGDGTPDEGGWWTVVAPEGREHVRDLWIERARLGAAFTQGARIHDGRGRPRWLAGRWEPHRPVVGEAASWVGTFTDVTEQRTLEDQLHQAQKLEAIGRLTGGLAHDFNNLLSVILTNTQLMAMGGDGLGTEEKEMLSDVEQAAKAGRDLVKRLMGFSRKAELSLAEVDLGAAVRDAERLARKLVPESIALSVTVEEPSPRVRADPRAVEQMLLNLVANARDAMPEGGAIRISIEAVDADAEFRGERPWVAPGPYGCLAVSDEGHGMDEATLEQIFEPFFTTKPEGRGTGLGLATVHGLMRQHEGHVRVYSQPGEGSTFRLYFPAATPERVSGSPEGAPKPVVPISGARRGLTILLVEDDPALRRTSARMLTRLGYRVVEAGDGAEALRRLDDQPGLANVVFSDLAMPGMGGIELHRALRERGDTIPFVFTSGLGQRDVAERGILPTDARFLAKPWAAAQFLEVMRSLDLQAG